MMRKALTMATLASLLIAGSAFAQWGRHAVAKPDATFAAGVGGAAAGPSSTNNDDSCDIGVAPAATLLLPYFEVETGSRSTTTFFQVTNTSRYPQVAHVTLWTDWSFPVLDFNIFLTGYDVQAIDLYDVIVNSQINGTTGTTSATVAGKVYNQLGTAVTVASYAVSGETGNPNFGIGGAGGGAAGCVNLPGQFNTDIGAAVKSALISGVYNSPGFNPTLNANGCTTAQLVGTTATHGGTTSATTAIGYVTIDVAAICSARLPNDPTYFQQEILFDNVLTGDYEIFNKAAGNNYAGGNPLVHIRAVPEGGFAGAPAPVGVTVSATNFPYSFYSRYVNGAAGTALLNYDRRQPLPSVFAARYIYSAAGNVATGLPPLNTTYRIWREGTTGANVANAPWNATACATPMSVNSALPIREIVRFDEHENAVIITNIQGVSPNLGTSQPTLPETSNRSVADTTVYPQFPTSVSSDVGGWMYLNLDNKFYTQNAIVADIIHHPAFAAGGTATRASQNWVVVSESGSTANNNAAGAYSVDFDATWLGNGCSGVVPVTTVNGGAAILGPVGGSVTGFTNVTP